MRQVLKRYRLPDHLHGNLRGCVKHLSDPRRLLGHLPQGLLAVERLATGEEPHFKAGAGRRGHSRLFSAGRRRSRVMPQALVIPRFPSGRRRGAVDARTAAVDLDPVPLTGSVEDVLTGCRVEEVQLRGVDGKIEYVAYLDLGLRVNPGDELIATLTSPPLD